MHSYSFVEKVKALVEKKSGKTRGEHVNVYLAGTHSFSHMYTLWVPTVLISIPTSAHYTYVHCTSTHKTNQFDKHLEVHMYIVHLHVYMYMYFSAHKVITSFEE